MIFIKKICVVGCGRWGQNHIKTLKKIGCLGGVVETDINRLAEFLIQYPHVRGYLNLEDAITDGYDGFIIATPADTHFNIGSFLIGKKQNVLIEKPMALTSADSGKLVQLAHENGSKLMVGHVMLFHPAIKKIKELIDEGKIGTLKYIYSNRLNLGKVRCHEDVFWSFAPHDISIFDYITGKYPVSIWGDGVHILQKDIFDSALASLTYPDNVKAHIFVSWLHPFKEHRLVIIGSKGMISFEDSTMEKQLLLYNKGVNIINGKPVKWEENIQRITYDKSEPLENELRYFIENMDSDIEVANGQSGHNTTKILEEVSQCMYQNVVKCQEDKKENQNYFIHQSSYMDDDVQIGDGTKIWNFSHIQKGARIGRNCTIGQNVNIANNVIIGNNVKIQNNVSIYEGIELEDYVFCGPSCVFTNVKNPRCKYPQKGENYYKKTIIKEGASIGANATIVCGNTIGRNAFIAAGAVVTSDVPDYALMVGIPAKRKGWICECGEQLKEDLICEICGKVFSENFCILKEVT